MKLADTQSLGLTVRTDSEQTFLVFVKSKIIHCFRMESLRVRIGCGLYSVINDSLFRNSLDGLRDMCSVCMKHS